jgi:hypothetical protein
MFGKKTSANAQYIMDRGTKVGNFKAKAGGTADVSHDKKAGMKYGRPTEKPAMHKKKDHSGVKPQVRVSSPRAKVGAVGVVES